jgi:glycosyltransferase involved in cell wall biosynthesis
VCEALDLGYRIARHLEVIIVDDASIDGSGMIADRLASEHPELHVLHNNRNRKLGATLRRGFDDARNEWILYMDSDLPVRAEEGLNALPLTEQADMVIGWRLSRAESLRREIMSFVYNRVIRFCFGLHVRDVNFAFKLFRRSYYQRICLHSEGSFIDAEFLMEMSRVGARISEIPMVYYPRVAGISTLSNWCVVGTILREMIYYRVLTLLPQQFRNACYRRSECRRLRTERGS